MLANLFHQTNGNLDTVIGGLVQQKQQNLGGEHLMGNLLIDQVGQESGAAQTNSLVVSLESLAELDNQAVDQQFSNLRKLGVDNGSHGGVYSSER